MSKQYQNLSAVYDSFMYDVSYGEWAAYINTFLRSPEENPRVLEYACGTGNMTLELLKLGYDVTAVDVSDSMLSEAAAKIGASPYSAQFVLADMTALDLDKQFDAIVCACDGLNYVTGEAALSSLFVNAARNLRSGGLFVFDISSEYKLSSVLGDEFFFDDSDEATLFWQNFYDKSARTVTMEITLFQCKGNVYQRFDERHLQKAWRQSDIEHAALKNGFSGADAYAFGTRDRPGKNCERLQFSTRKDT